MEGTAAAVFWIAVAVSGLFSAAQVALTVLIVPVLIGIYGETGTDLPAVVTTAQTLGPLGIIAIMTAIDLSIFAVFVWAAKRYWVGLLFVPPLLYLFGAFVIFVTLVGEPFIAGSLGS